MSEEKAPLTPEERTAIINRLDEAFQKMSTMDKAIVKHSMGAPRINPGTGEAFASFREVITVSVDSTLETLMSDFIYNGFIVKEES